MSISEIRYKLTDYIPKENGINIYENNKLLISPEIGKNNLNVLRIKEDLRLLPKVVLPKNDYDLYFYEYNYHEEIYNKSEVLAFLYASINHDFDIILGIDIKQNKYHFWLKNGDIVYDPSLAIITTCEKYQEFYKSIQEINNSNIEKYVETNDNLYGYFHTGKKKRNKKKWNFSMCLIDVVKKHFLSELEKKYTLSEERIEEVKNSFSINEFADFKQLMTQKRKYILNQNTISMHPNVNADILKKIESIVPTINEMMEKEFEINANYYENTLGNCYALSILLNLFDSSFTLVQGGIHYIDYSTGLRKEEYYQHSWNEIGDYVYDPALRIITLKDLYYLFVTKESEYNTEETKNILRKIGFNLTHFKDYLEGKEVGHKTPLSYYFSKYKIGSKEKEAEGEELLSTINKYKNRIRK